MRQRNRRTRRLGIAACTVALAASVFTSATPGHAQTEKNAGQGGKDVDTPVAVKISADQCSADHLGQTIDPNKIGEPVSSVTLTRFTWVAATGGSPAYCRVDGRMAPIDPSAADIGFAVALPALWTHRATHLGGGGNNGVVPKLDGANPGSTETYLSRGWVTYGSDSGHESSDSDWALVDEAVMNFGYMQLKKTHDAAWELIERAYGTSPTYSYFVGNSQGGREALTVAQRYPRDYDGIISRVPVVSLSTLQLSSALRAIQEKPLENWVTPAKTTAIAAEIMRQCDDLDGLADGVINNYQGCRNKFDPAVEPVTGPWAAKRCPNNVDPAPDDTSAEACLTDGQISTLEFAYSRYEFATPLADAKTDFGMWVPSIDIMGPGQAPHILDQRFRGQEGADETAPILTWGGKDTLVSELFQDFNANPLDYVEGGPLNDRRETLSTWLDSTNPNLHEFRASGGKLLSVSGTGDTRAASGAQLDYYQSVLDTMGKHVEDFARLWVMPQGDHGLGGSSHTTSGDGQVIDAFDLPNQIDYLSLLTNWVENDTAPPTAPVVTAEDRSLPLCTYPHYPRYDGEGPVEDDVLSRTKMV